MTTLLNDHYVCYFLLLNYINLSGKLQVKALEISFSIISLPFPRSHKACIFSLVQSLSRVRLFVSPWITASQASLSITNSWSLPKLMSIKSMMPSSHLILWCPLLLPPIPPSIRVFPMSQLFAWGGQSIGVSASTSVLPMNTRDWSPLGWTGWIFLQSKGLTQKSLLQHHSLETLILWSSAFFTVLFSHPFMTNGKTIANLYFMKNYLWIVVIIFKSTEKLAKSSYFMNFLYILPIGKAHYAALWQLY